MNTLFVKLATILFLTLLLMIPLQMISSTSEDRQHYKNVAISAIANSIGGSQQIKGIILVVPYLTKSEKNVDLANSTKLQEVWKNKYFLPETISIQNTLYPKELYKGIYKVPTYSAIVAAQGYFDISELFDPTDNMLEYKDPYLILALDNIIGISPVMHLKVNGKDVPIMPGTQSPIFPYGTHANFKIEYKKEQKISFDYNFELQGVEKLSFTPIGKYTEISVESLWPNPSFRGKFAPTNRQITKEGFAAQWQISSLNSNILENFENCIYNDKCQDFNNLNSGVSLYQGIDIYQEVTRSLKYCILFIILTFIALLLVEILGPITIHPVHYTLVGLSLVIFYLLLLSLSEHMSFMHSYIIASISCAGLLGYYTTFVLHSYKRGLTLALSLVGLYIMLYCIILSQDHALLMGTLLLFLMLASIMILTRKVDWYKIQK
ncbi:MAG: cell envelope integrity protein CreD [Rickettsiaceae bacterium]